MSNERNPAVDRAERAYQYAAERYVAAIERWLPLGTEIRARVGSKRFTGVVTSHGSWWASPNRVTIRINSSGTYRSVDTTDVEIIREPGE